MCDLSSGYDGGRVLIVAFENTELENNMLRFASDILTGHLCSHKLA